MDQPVAQKTSTMTRLDDDRASPTESSPLLPGSDDTDGFESEDAPKMIMFWQEMRTLLKFASPIFGAQILEYSLVFVPVISIGHLSTKALAAVSLGSMTGSVTGFSILQGLGSALDTLFPSTFTSSQPHLVGLWAQRMAVVMAVALVPIYILWFNAETVLLALRQDPDVARLAAQNLRWLSLSLPGYALNCITRRYFQSQGLFSVQTRIICFIAPVNVLLNYLLVWGPEPIHLGFIGAPIATAASTSLVSLASIVYGIYYVPHTAWHPFSRKMFTNLGVITRLGVAGVGQTASEWWAWELIALAASLLGPVALASQSILLTSCAMTFQVAYALANATAIRVGNLLGEKKARRAGVAANTSIIIALVTSTAISALYLTFRNSWAYMFNNDPEVVHLVASVIPLIALFQYADGNSVVTAGILRARGKQFIGAAINISAYYVIGLPFGIWLAFHWTLGLHGLWIGLTISLIYCSVLGTYLCIRTDWNEEVKKVEDRIAEEERVKAAINPV